MASVWRHAEEGQLEEDIDTLLETQAAGENAKDSILFLIDCASSMFVEQDGEIPWVSSVKCVIATMKNKIISSEDDLIGILLYNTRKEKNASSFKGIYMLQPIDVPDAERIRELDRLSKNLEAFKSQIGSADEETILGNVFWSCSSVFGPLKKKRGSMRIFMFTNNDEPHPGNVALQRAAKIRSRDLSDLGILIELFNLDRPGHKFDASLFYADVIPAFRMEEDEIESTAASMSSTEKFEELMDKVRRKESRKRALGKMGMKLSEGVVLSIRLYSLFMEATKGAHVWMEAASGKLAKPVTEWIEQSSGSAIPRAILNYYYDFGGEKAIFTKDELAKVKDLGEPGLTILGFRPRGWLKPHYNLSHSTFIFPDETETRGSIVAFRALLQGMLELDRLAICSYIARRTFALRMVALLPQAEEIDPETGAQLKPAGMHLVMLPYAEDLRTLHHDGELVRADPELVDQAKEIIGKLTINDGFDSEVFENPVIQRHYANLQALALDQELEKDDLKDSVKPDIGRMQKRAGALIQGFNAMLPVAEAKPEKISGKRRPPAATKEDGEPDIAAIASDANKLGRITVPQLKAYAESIGLKPDKLKADIIAQIVAASSQK